MPELKNHLKTITLQDMKAKNTFTLWQLADKNCQLFIFHSTFPGLFSGFCFSFPISFVCHWNVSL